MHACLSLSLNKTLLTKLNPPPATFYHIPSWQGRYGGRWFYGGRSLHGSMNYSQLNRNPRKDRKQDMPSHEPLPPVRSCLLRFYNFPKHQHLLGPSAQHMSLWMIVHIQKPLRTWLYVPKQGLELSCVFFSVACFVLQCICKTLSISMYQF